MDNTEGSRVIPQIYKARKNLVLKLTKKQLSIVIGSILGDAYIYPQGKICFEQGQNQRDYLFWKYNQLKNLAYPKIATVTRFDQRYKKENTSYRFFLRQFFRPLRQLFYSQNQKSIPQSLSTHFTSLSLAVWFMDDGYLDSGRYPVFASENYTSKDNDFLIQLLKTKFKINTHIAGKNRIRVSSDSIDEFFQLIEPWIIPSLRYKLP